LGVCGLGISDSFLMNNKVSAKWGQLHTGSVGMGVAYINSSSLQK
jgi:galactitol-specific phosphotransferase system IIB component